MAKSHSIAQAKYDKAHCKYYTLKMNLETDADVIEQLSSVPSMQGYILPVPVPDPYPNPHPYQKPKQAPIPYLFRTYFERG